MAETWFCILSVLLITYVVLDGRNFGAGALQHVVARTLPERRQIVAAIGPLWSWHEVWLVAFGGTLLLAFPKLLASAFSGYYLALFMVLWLLILRGLALEVGGHVTDALWQTFWNFVLTFSSGLLALLAGVALGNTARGVPVNAAGEFHMALFTDFGVRGNVGLVDWYTLSTGVWTLALFCAHGACHLATRSEGPVRERSARAARVLWLLAGALTAVVIGETLLVRPELFANAAVRPAAWAGGAAILGAAALLAAGLWKGRPRQAAIASHLLLAGLLSTSIAAAFPLLLRSTLDPRDTLDIYNCAADGHSLKVALFWWPVAFVMTWLYAWYITRAYRGGGKSAY
jgi:cytochrome d ubiquinol oxidase subunit II